MITDAHRPLHSILNAEMSFPKVSVLLHTVEVNAEPFEITADRPDTEITYIESITRTGAGPHAYFDISDRRTRTSTMGRVVLHPGGLKLRVFGEGTGSSRILMCTFDEDYFIGTTGLHQWSEPMLARCNNLQSHIVAATMRRILIEMKSNQHGCELAVECLANLVMVEIGRLFLSDKSSSSARRRLAPWQIRKIEECLREIANHWPSLNELAALCGVSAKHLSRVFSESMGMPLSKYSEQIRIERAQQLLSESHLAVKEVATTLGFANANYFSSAFHRATGESPTDFIRRT